MTTTNDNGMMLRGLDDVERLARLATTSGLCRVKRPEEAAVILLTGRELGLSPMQSLRGIYVVNGAPVLSSDLLVAVVRRSGLCASWRVVESTPDACTITTIRQGESESTTKTWTMLDAKRAQVTGKPIWSQYPAQMLRHRCAADLAREVYPDVVLGLYTPEEMDSVERHESPREIAVVRAPAPVAAPSLAPLGVEAPAAPAPVAFTTPGLSADELAAMLAMLGAAKTIEALDAVRAEIRPDVSTRATAPQRNALRHAAEARRAALAPQPPPTGTDSPSGPRNDAAMGDAASNDGAPSAEAQASIARVGDPRAYLATKGTYTEIERAVVAHGAYVAGLAPAAVERLEAMGEGGDDANRTRLVAAWVSESASRAQRAERTASQVRRAA